LLQLLHDSVVVYVKRCRTPPPVTAWLQRQQAATVGRAGSTRSARVLRALADVLFSTNDVESADRLTSFFSLVADRK
jgi:hypothetical protein